MPVIAMSSGLQCIAAPRTHLLSLVLYAPILTLAHHAQSPAVMLRDEIFGSVSVSTLHLPHHRDRGSCLVFYIRYRLKVTPVHAPSVSARMVQLLAAWNRPHEYLV